MTDQGTEWSSVPAGEDWVPLVPQKYKIVHALSASQLEDAVNRLLREGWQLQGGIAFTRGSQWSTEDRCFQAMVK